MDINDEQLMNEILEGQIPEAVDSVPDLPENNSQVQETQSPVETLVTTKENSMDIQPETNSLVGQKLKYMKGNQNPLVSDEEKNMTIEENKKRHISMVGDNIFKNAELREGWIPVNKDLLGDRAYFYPDEWEFRIRPATVEAIRNWSNIDENNPLAVDDVLNEVIKSCLTIVTPNGNIPWGNINSWDRFYFLLLIREYSFLNGEAHLKYEEDCPDCDQPVTFELKSDNLIWELPDSDIIQYFDPETKSWTIDPREYDVDADPFTLWIPNLEKDANWKAWLIDRTRNQPNKKTEQAFLRFLSWMTPKISRDLDIAKKQIKDLEMKFKNMDAELFSFMDEVIRNITVTLLPKLVTTCPNCGQEVTAQIRFPGKLSDLFAVQNKHRKFGSK